MKGWIALDIDGTITSDKYSIPIDVLNYLLQAHLDGWRIVLATGRAFAFAKRALEKIDFPFFIFPQNGSVGISIPGQEILFRHYMSRPLLDVIEEAYLGIKSDFLIYSGYELGDFCYFRPNKFSSKELNYLDEVQTREQTKWKAVDEFPLDIASPLVKCFGRLDHMRKLAQKLEKTDLFQLALIRDPFHKDNHILMVTDRKACKGKALQEMISRLGKGKLVIAAGDDENDLSLLRAADIKIAMPQAPETVRAIADFIAPPVEELGIVAALKIATRK